MAEIVFYGSEWCSDCKRSKELLDRQGIVYTYVDLGVDESAAAKVEEINHGFRSIPTIVFPDGRVLVEPTNHKLEAVLQMIHALPSPG